MDALSAAREAVEVASDRKEQSIVDAVGDDLDEPCTFLERAADSIREQIAPPERPPERDARR